MENQRPDTGRLLAKLTWDLMKTQGPFQTVADLTDALKTRCRRLRVRYTNDDINAAFRLIESNTPLCQDRVTRSAPVEPADVIISPDRARDILAEIRRRTGVTPTVRPMPKGQLITGHQAAQGKAMAMVVKEIEATVERIKDLERDLE